mmetsp:Transcript_30839/g.71660  ORF Transcript_30839/g.71660 Transcript_30839/m.71660 type:complete len:258 (+) Transcript_30839:160-933(+)
MQLGRRVQSCERLAEHRELPLVDQVRLVHDEDVAALHLFAHQVDDLSGVLLRKVVLAQILALVHSVALLKLAQESRRVDNRDQRVQLRALQHFGLRLQRVPQVVADLARLGDARRLDDDMVPRHAARCRHLHQLFNRIQELFGNGAASAAIRQLHGILLQRRAPASGGLGRHQGLVNVDLSDVIHNHTNLESRLILEDVLEQRSLARAEKAREQGDRHERLARGDSLPIFQARPGTAMPIFCCAQALVVWLAHQRAH